MYALFQVVLVFRPTHMELVRTKDRLIPPGRKVIQGGYEEDGWSEPLFELTFHTKPELPPMLSRYRTLP